VSNPIAFFEREQKETKERKAQELNQYLSSLEVERISAREQVKRSSYLNTNASLVLLCSLYVFVRSPPMQFIVEFLLNYLVCLS
jgi:hypothetical protein